MTIEAVGIDAAIRPVGVRTDGQMQLPTDPRVLGWYQFGPAPTSQVHGSTVLAGHVDSAEYGIGPLVQLRDVDVGDRILVRSRRDALARYRVSAVEHHDRDALPADVFSRVGPRRLRVITCSGGYDADAGGYQQNLVVTGVPV